MHTVKQAVQLICPIRPATPRPSMCASDRCAMWRWNNGVRARKYATPKTSEVMVTEHASIREYDGEFWNYEFTKTLSDGTRVDVLWQFVNDTDDTPRGYCGLAGMPQQGPATR